MEIDIPRSGARKRSAQGRVGCARRGRLGVAEGDWAGVGQRAKVESRGREREKRKRAEQKPHVCFGRKMIYEKKFRIPFS